MNLNRNMLLILAVLCGAATAIASNVIHGRVIDAVTGAPVLAANIVVVGTDEGAASDAAGNFTINTKLALPVEILISHIAYEDFVTTIGGDSTWVIELAPASIEGEKIIVTGSRFQPGPDVSAVVETITLEAVENLGARNLGDVLRPMASVTINATNSGKQYASIRGGNPNEVAVFLDGIRLNDVNTGVADLSAIDLTDMEKIEVVKGGSSTLSGNGAFSGVINLTSQLPDSNHATILGGYGTTDPADRDLAYSASLRKGIFAVGGNYLGKARQYDGSSIYTSIFNSRAGAMYLANGNLSVKQYDLEKYINLNNDRVVQSDRTRLNNIRYQGSILSSNEWDLFAGRRHWSWNDNYFSSITRDYTENSYSGKIGHKLSNHLGSAIIQYDRESQSFSVINSYASNIVNGTAPYLENNRLNRDTQGFVTVLRADSESGSPFLALLRWEASIRLSQITTTHKSMLTLIDTLANLRQPDELLLDRTERSFDVNQKYGVRLEGSSHRMDYSLFFNQGHNTRPPSLNDYSLWANSHPDIDEATPLRSESVATTEIGTELMVRPAKYSNIDLELSLNSGIYYNVYDNKIAFEYFPERPPEPYNILNTRIRGFEINGGCSILGRKILGRIGYRNLSLNDPRVYTNKPAYRYSGQLELRYPWLVIQLDGYNDGPQFVVLNGRRSTIKLIRQSVNLNVMYRWNIKHFSMSLSYSIKNLLNFVGQSGDDVGLSVDPYAYFEQQRQIITLRIKL